MPGSREGSLPLHLNPLYHTATNLPTSLTCRVCPSCTLHFSGQQKGPGNISWTVQGQCAVLFTDLNILTISQKTKAKTGPHCSKCCILSYHNSREPIQSRSDPFTDASPPWIPMHEQKSLSLLPALNPLVYFKAAFELTWHLQMQNLKLLCWGFKEGK